MASMARDTSTKQTKKQKNREIEACLVDQSITANSGRRKKEEAVCVCVRACVRVRVTMT